MTLAYVLAAAILLAVVAVWAYAAARLYRAQAARQVFQAVALGPGVAPLMRLGRIMRSVMKELAELKALGRLTWAQGWVHEAMSQVDLHRKWSAWQGVCLMYLSDDPRIPDHVADMARASGFDKLVRSLVVVVRDDDDDEVDHRLVEALRTSLVLNGGYRLLAQAFLSQEKAMAAALADMVGAGLPAAAFEGKVALVAAAMYLTLGTGRTSCFFALPPSQAWQEFKEGLATPLFLKSCELVYFKDELGELGLIDRGWVPEPDPAPGPPVEPSEG